jgi:hypothetical protein
MYRVIAFVLGVVVCLWVLDPSYAQKDPKPYDDSKRKKSAAKSDTTKAKESDESKADKAKADKAKADKAKADKAAADKAKADKAAADKAKADKAKADKAKADKAKADKAKADKAKANKPQTVESQVKKSETSKPAAAKSTASGHIARAVFTSAIVDREPADALESLTNQSDKIYFFTEIIDMQGKQVTHQWIYEDKVVAEVPFQVGGPRWRVYSRKRLAPGWVGRWTVVVVDETGRKLREDNFTYVGSAQ